MVSIGFRRRCGLLLLVIFLQCVGIICIYNYIYTVYCITVYCLHVSILYTRFL